jgi:hypothetical protein
MHTHTRSQNTCGHSHFTYCNAQAQIDTYTYTCAYTYTYTPGSISGFATSNQAPKLDGPPVKLPNSAQGMQPYAWGTPQQIPPPTVPANVNGNGDANGHSFLNGHSARATSSLLSSNVSTSNVLSLASLSPIAPQPAPSHGVNHVAGVSGTPAILSKVGSVVYSSSGPAGQYTNTMSSGKLESNGRQHMHSSSSGVNSSKASVYAGMRPSTAHGALAEGDFANLTDPRMRASRAGQDLSKASATSRTKFDSSSRSSTQTNASQAQTSAGSRPGEPLLYAVALVGLPPGVQEHAHEGCGASGTCAVTRKDEGLLTGTLQPHLLAMHTPKTTDSQAPVSLAGLICAFATPCGARIRNKPESPLCYSTMLPRSGLPPLFLHCRFSYRCESGTPLSVQYGAGGPVYVPECLVVASEATFHDSLSTALSMFCDENEALSSPPISAPNGAGSGTEAWAAAHHTSRASMLEALASALACEVPPPRMPLYIQVGHTPVHCQRPDTRDLPLADLDFAPLLRSLEARNVARLLVLLLCKEPQVVLISDAINDLFPAACALIELMYPFIWSHSFVPVLPPSLLSFLDSPHPYLLGIHRPCVPRGRIPSHVVVVDLTYNTVSVPASVSEAGFDALVSLFESRIAECTQAAAAKYARFSEVRAQRHMQGNGVGMLAEAEAMLAADGDMSADILPGEKLAAATHASPVAEHVHMHSERSGNRRQDTSPAWGRQTDRGLNGHSPGAMGDNSNNAATNSIHGLNHGGARRHQADPSGGAAHSSRGQNHTLTGSEPKVSLLPAHIHMPGAWGSASTGLHAAMHAMVKSMRDGLASDLAMILFRFPLFLHGPRQPLAEDAVDKRRRKATARDEPGGATHDSTGARSSALDGVTFDASSFAASADEDHYAFVRALCMTKIFTGVRLSRTMSTLVFPLSPWLLR